MDPTSKRRRFVLPLLAATGAVAIGGWSAVDPAVDNDGLASPREGIETAADPTDRSASNRSLGGGSTLDGIEAVWQAEALQPPASTNPSEAPQGAPRYGGAPVDPFLAEGTRVGPLASTDPPPQADRKESEALVARGQQPAGGAIDIAVTTELPAGNPLRSGGEDPISLEQQAIARRFGEGPYAADPYAASADEPAPTPRHPNDADPIRVDIGPNARVQPAAAESDPPPVAPLPVGGPRYADAAEASPRGSSSEPPPALSRALSGVANPTSEPAPASDESLPLVDFPIAPPTAPRATPEPVAGANDAPPMALPSRNQPPPNEPALDEPAPRLATRQPAYGASGGRATMPGPFNPGADLSPVPVATRFDGPPASTPAAPRPGDPSLEGRQQPSLAVQKFAPKAVQVGKPCRFLVKIRNDSPRALADVVVNDRTPSGSRLVSTRPTAQTSGDAVRWLIGTLGAGEERTLEMEIVPTEEGEIGSVATVSFAAQASAKTSVTRPQLALRLTAPSQVLVGQEQRLRIEVHNPGTGDATNVVLSEDVPANLRHEAGASVEFEIGTLRPGETRRLELVMNAEAPGPVSNVLVARADGDLRVQQQVDFEVVAPELSVAVQGPKRRYLQRPATYAVRIDNPGTAAARDIRLVARLPRGMQFVKANNLGEYDRASHAVYWALAELPPGEGGEVQVTALPVRPGEMTIEAEGKSGSGLADRSSHQVKVQGVAAVDFQVLDVEDPIEVGGQTEYEVRVDNQGTAEATGVRVRLVAPPGMRVLSASGPTRHAIDARGVTFEPLGRLAPGGENRYRVRVQAESAGDQRMTVEVTTDDLTQPVRKEEATRVFGDE